MKKLRLRKCLGLLNLFNAARLNANLTVFGSNRAVRWDPKNYPGLIALLRVGVDPNCTNEDGQTPLLLCLENLSPVFRLKILKILLEGNKSRHERIPPRKVDLNVKDPIKQRNAFQLLLENAVDTNGSVYEALSLLVHEGIDILSEDASGRSALHYVCECYDQENILDVIQLLVDNNIDVNLEDNDGRTALHLLCLCSNYESENIIPPMKLLMKNGADVNLEDQRGRTALHHVRYNYKRENIYDAMKILIDNAGRVKVDLKGENAERTALLHSLCQYHKRR